MIIDDTFLTTLFCIIDDFCKAFEKHTPKKVAPKKDKDKKTREKPSRTTLSEIMCILILFHISGYKDFKSFYLQCVLLQLKPYFPKIVGYSRFIQMMREAFVPLFIFLHGMRGEETGIYFVDSSAIEVCHIKRERQHKVFKGIAKKSKTTTGWFFGFKLHLIINNLGEIMSIKFSCARTDDRKPVQELMQKLRGWLFGDKGYIGKDLFESLKLQAITLVTKTKKNMQKKVLDPLCAKLLKARGIIETVIGLLKNFCMIEHTRHRSSKNAFTHIMAGLVTYQLRSRKPSVKPGRMPKETLFLF